MKGLPLKKKKKTANRSVHIDLFDPEAALGSSDYFHNIDVKNSGGSDIFSFETFFKWL